MSSQGASSFEFCFLPEYLLVAWLWKNYGTLLSLTPLCKIEMTISLQPPTSFWLWGRSKISCPAHTRGYYDQLRARERVRRWKGCSQVEAQRAQEAGGTVGGGRPVSPGADSAEPAGRQALGTGEEGAWRLSGGPGTAGSWWPAVRLATPYGSNTRLWSLNVDLTKCFHLCQEKETEMIPRTTNTFL